MNLDKWRQYSGLEVALLGVFALGLLFSYALVVFRSQIRTSAPVALPVGSIAAPLPVGAGWRTVDSWRYEKDNAFVLVALKQERGQTAITVRWRYALAEPPVEPTEALAQRAKQANARRVDLGQIGKNLPMTCALIEPAGAQQAYLMGLANLPYGRRLELFVGFDGQAAEYAQVVFETLVAGLVHQPCPMLDSGQAAVAAFYQRLSEQVAAWQTPRVEMMVIADPLRGAGGYAIKRYWGWRDTDNQTEHLRITQTIFQPQGNFWQYDLWLTPGDRAYTWTAQFAPASAAATNRLGPPRHIRQNARGQILIQPRPAEMPSIWRTAQMVPEPLVELFVSQLPADAPTMVVDVLTAAGAVIAVQIAPIPLTKLSFPVPENALFAKQLTYTHSANAFEQLSFDAQGRCVGRLEQPTGQTRRLWSPATVEQLEQIFGAPLFGLGAANAAGESAESEESQPQSTDTECTEPMETEQSMQQRQMATFAAGCFWGVEHFFAAVPGVVVTQVGYTGGSVDKPTYEQVCSGKTGHAEAVRIEFDPTVITYRQLVQLFFKMHDPTTPNRQGPDVGSQYRSAIFYHTPSQRWIAQDVIDQLTAQGVFSRPIVTELAPAGPFWPAEEYHQRYFEKNPHRRSCHPPFSPSMLER